MKYFLMLSALGFLAGCGDKDEDTGGDSGESAEEASDTAE